MGSVLNGQTSRLTLIFCIAVATLPYGFYLNLLIILIVAFMARRQMTSTGQSWLDPLSRGCLLAVSMGMMLSTITALNRGEAALQLANFLPFFGLFTILPFLVRSPFTQRTLARWWVLSSIPINGVAIAEYLAKGDRLPALCYGIGFVQAWRDAPHIGRAMVMFDHPNVFANYLIIILGLSLGLILSSASDVAHAKAYTNPEGATVGHAESEQASGQASGQMSGQASVIRQRLANLALERSPQWFWLAGFLCLVGLFCSGSRNGILVAGSQILLWMVLTTLNRKVLLLGALGIIGFGVSIFKLGLGTRSIGILQVMDDPRVGVWKIALDLIAERPWLGWGPGSFKFLYPARLIDPTYKNVFHTHNLWLLLGAEYGLPVMLGLTIAIGFICYRAARYWLEQTKLEEHKTPQMPLLKGYGLALLGCVQFSLIDVTFYDARLNVMTWVLLSVLYAQSLGQSDG